MDIKMITALHSVLDAVVDEAENNEVFASKLELAFTVSVKYSHVDTEP